MLIVGEKEAENGEVSVRRQGEGDKGTMKFEEFAKMCIRDRVYCLFYWQRPLYVCLLRKKKMQRRAIP